MAKKLALGKGIASLLQDTTPQSVVNQTYNNQYGNKHDNDEILEQQNVQQHKIEIRYENTPLLVDVGAIKTNPNQPRKIFKEKDLDELSESIKENGIIQPLIVAELENRQYELVAVNSWGIIAPFINRLMSR